jgi:hypothetical protein
MILAPWLQENCTFTECELIDYFFSMFLLAAEALIVQDQMFESSSICHSVSRSWSIVSHPLYDLSRSFWLGVSRCHDLVHPLGRRKCVSLDIEPQGPRVQKLSLESLHSGRFLRHVFAFAGQRPVLGEMLEILVGVRQASAAARGIDCLIFTDLFHLAPKVSMAFLHIFML